MLSKLISAYKRGVLDDVMTGNLGRRVVRRKVRVNEKLVEQEEAVMDLSAYLR